MSDAQPAGPVGAAGESIHAFLERLKSSAPTPGGGAVAALAGALGAALAHMVAALTAGKKKFAAVDAEFRAAMPGLEAAIVELEELMDADARAFDAVMAAMRLPKTDPAEAEARARALEAAALHAAEVPLRTLDLVATLLPAVELAAAKGNPHAVSDAGMAALLVIAAARAAAMNVRINLAMLAPERARPLAARVAATLDAAVARAGAVAASVEARL